MIYETRKLTKDWLDKKCPAVTETTIIWDEGYPYKGHKFGVRLTPGGTRSFIVRYNIPASKSPDGKKKQAAPNLMDVDEFVRSGMVMDDIHELALDTVRDGKKAKALPSDIARAEREQAAREEREAQQEAAQKRSEGLTIAQAGEDYLAFHKANRSWRGANTYGNRKRAIEKAAAFWGDTPIKDLGRKDVTALLNWVGEEAVAASEKRDRANSSAGRHGGRVAEKNPGQGEVAMVKSAIKNVLIHAASEMDIDCRTDICDHYKPKTNPPKRGSFTSEEKDTFFIALGKWAGKSPSPTAQDTVDIMRLAFLSGGRSGEWSKAKWSQVHDLDGDTPEWQFEPGERKQGSEHVQPLDADMVAILKAIRDRREARWGPINRMRDFIFPAAYAKLPSDAPRSDYASTFNKIMEKTGINDGKDYLHRITPHRAFRASRITEFRDVEQMSAKEVSDHVGLSERMIEDVYYTPQDKAKRAHARARRFKSSLPQIAAE